MAYEFLLSKSTSQQVNKSTSQRVNESTSQQVNESTSQRVNKSTSQRVNESTSQRVNKSTSQQVNESTRLKGQSILFFIKLRFTSFAPRQFKQAYLHSVCRQLLHFSFFFFFSLLCSCEKNCRYDALDGFWRVDEVTDRTTGITTEGNARLFMSFEYQLVKLSWLSENRNVGCLGNEFIASCSVDDGMLTFGTFYKYRSEDLLAPAEKLASFGLPYDSPSTFTLTYSHNGRQASLFNPTTLITLTKY